MNKRFPKVPIERRALAFFIDFATVWLICSITSNFFAQLFVFSLSWFILRVVVADKNQGQSLGRWALDMKIIDPRINKIPDLITLSKREGILGAAAFLAMIGLNLGWQNPLSLLILISPLVADCGAALADEELNQAFHDRLMETIIIQTKRGYSLDLRLKKLINEAKKNLKK